METLQNFERIIKWLSQGKQTALATVIWKQGSALRSVGAKMAISSEMEMSGSISGGCVEGAVVQEAQKVMNSDQAVVLEYGIADETAWSVGLACGGAIRVLVQKVETGEKRGLNIVQIERMIELLNDGVPFATMVDLSQVNMGSFVLLKNDEIHPADADGWIDKQLRDEVRRMAETESSGIVKTNGQHVFVDIYAPPPRLIAIGAVHIAQPLIQMAQITGFSTVVIDPRKAFNTESRFPNVGQRLLIWPDEGLREVGLNANDYVVLLSHDDKLDLPALEMALDSEVKYIGMLSSRQARDKRFELLKENGYSHEQLERVHSPVGLDIGARSQEEIALSILAEITAIRYGKRV